MRATPDNFFPLFESGRMCVDIRVLVDGREITDLLGKNWVKSISYGADANTPVNTIDIQANQRIFQNNLSPFVSSSRFNNPRTLMDVNREVEFYVATVPMDSAAKDSDYRLAFKGKIDDLSIDPSRNTISINARDPCGDLQDIYLEDPIGAPRTYGPGSAESVIQSIINDGWSDAFGGGAVAPVLQLPQGSPGFTVSAGYAPGVTSIMQAITSISELFGWEIRCVFDDSVDGYSLVLQSPVRLQPKSDYEFDKRIININSVTSSKTQVRNRIDVVHPGAGAGFASASDQDSEDRYGPRYMRITEGAGSQIDTDSEAQDLADRALSDLKDPVAITTLTTQYFFPVEVNDIYTIPADSKVFGADQDLNVKSYRHTIAANSPPRTQMTLAGKPAVGSRYHLLRRDDLSELQ